MKRFEIIDGMRGYFLVFMLINHLVFVGEYWLMEVNHRNLAFVEDAQGFVFVILVAQLLIPDATKLWYNWLGQTNFDQPLRLAAIATFVFQPTFMDILPQYTVYLLFAPLLISLCLEGRWPHVLIGSFLVWVAAQLGLMKYWKTTRTRPDVCNEKTPPPFCRMI